MTESEKAAQSSRNLQAQELAKANPEHVHKWRLHTHVDGCHFHQSVYTCECGAVQAHGGERNFLDPDDPYAAVFAVDECARCQELLKGATPRELV